MRYCRCRWTRVLAIVGLLALAAAPALAQGGGTSTTLSGLVVDTSGAVIPGADVTAKNNANATEFRAVTDSGGRFTIPAVMPGTYTVKVSLMGFKTWATPDVQALAATPASVRAVLEVGALEETVIVEGATEIVQTQTASVQTTIAVKQIEALPLVTHTALDYVVHMPGVSTTGSDTRGSTISGLPQNTINITLDGVNAQDNRSRSDGFFMFIRPMMDSVEEITVSTSTPGAESTGNGATQIRMVTRSGTNRFAGSIYNTWRNQAGTTDDDVMGRKNKRGWLWRLNSPYWFNKRDRPKTAGGDYFIDDIRLQTPGFRVGGPILKDKFFYFFNQEWFRWPNQTNRVRYLMNENARKGLFTYQARDGSTRTINLLSDIAAKNGQTSTMDPTLSRLLGDIRTAASSEGGIEPYDENVDKYTYSPGGNQTRYFPTLRLDYNLTPANRLTFNGRFNSFKSAPDILNSYDARFPGFPNEGGQFSQRYMWQTSLRSTIGKSLVNEARVGYQDTTKQGVYFRPEVSESQFNCQDVGCQSAGGQGWALTISQFRSITDPTFSTSKTADVAPLLSLEDTVTWLKGRHTFSAGGSWTRVKYRAWSDTVVPQVYFGLSNLDPAYKYFTSTSNTFPGGINDTYAGYARDLYAVLTGRVTQVSGTAYLNPSGKYEYLGERTSAAQGDDMGVFISDAWRVKPNLTLTGGVRYAVQFPYTTDGLYSRPDSWQMVYGMTGAGSGQLGQGNLYKPGTLAGASPLVVLYPKGSSAYKTDWNNLAPSVGITWRPDIGNGFFSRILSSEPVFRGGYSVAYSQYGSTFFDGNYSGNPGRSRSATRSTTSGTPVIGYDGFPVLLRDTSKLAPGAFPDSPVYPISPAVNETLDIHHPDWRTPTTHQYSFGFQRELGKAMAIDIRYVGNTSAGAWNTWNMTANPQWALLENGFYKEFQLAQQNLRANIVAGKGNTFAYTGAPGTAPLPIFMAYYQGIPLADARNQNPANYTAPQFSNSSYYNNLGFYSANTGSTNVYHPGFISLAGTGTTGLQYSNLEANAAKAGLPVNFFQANPAVKQGNAYLETNGGNTRYNAMQVELRRRMSKGLLLAGSYTGQFARKTWAQRSLREDWHYLDSTGGPVHALKANWVFELPFGQGRKWGAGVGRVKEMLIGGWEVDGVARMQSGQRFNMGNYRLMGGLTEKELQSMFKLRKEIDGKGLERYYMWPKSFIEQSILALTTQSATSPTGYAGTLPSGKFLAPASGPDCVQYMMGMCPGTSEMRIIDGPWYYKVDMSVVKRIAVTKTVRVEARMDLYNIFDIINFIPNFNTTTGVPVGGSFYSSWEINAAARDMNASQDAGGRITQFGLRFTW